MNAIVQFNPHQVPAFAKKGELSDTAKALIGGGVGGKRVSIKGGVFRLISSGKEVGRIEDRHLDVVLIKAAPKIARVFYAKTYDADAITAPDCWSPDGETPSPDAANRQASRCAECPQNIAGSGQGQSRACRYQQRLAVVLADDVGGDVMQLALPATSIFGKAEGDNRPLQEYARWLAAQNINPEAVVTRMRFDTDSESPKLFFKPMRWLTDEEYATVEEQAASPDAQRAVTMTVAKMDAAPEPVKLDGAPPKGAKAAKAAPETEEAAPQAEAPKRRGRPPKAAQEPAETPEEPTVRKEAPKTPPVAPKTSLAAAVADAWDDE